MYVLVTLESSESCIVPIKWVKSLNLAECCNGGMNSDITVCIFFSPDKSKDANFALPIRNSLDENVDACYLVRQNKFYGKWIQHFCTYYSFDLASLTPLYTRNNRRREWSQSGAGQKTSDPAQSILWVEKKTSTEDKLGRWARARRRDNKSNWRRTKGSITLAHSRKNASHG